MSRGRWRVILRVNKALERQALPRVGEQTMVLRVLLAIASPVFGQTIRRMAEAAAELLPWPVEIEEAKDLQQLEEKLPTHPPTLLLWDWEWERETTLSLIPRLFERNPTMRIVVLLPPVAPKAYRAALWEAGACVSTPRDRLDEEWMVTVLCLIRRAMEREGLLRANPVQVSNS